MLTSLSSLNFINPKTILPNEWIVSSGDKVILGLIAGAVFGTLVGVFVWVVFPYEPTREPKVDKTAGERSTNVFD